MPDAALGLKTVCNAWVAPGAVGKAAQQGMDELDLWGVCRGLATHKTLKKN